MSMEMAVVLNKHVQVESEIKNRIERSNVALNRHIVLASELEAIQKDLELRVSLITGKETRHARNPGEPL